MPATFTGPHTCYQARCQLHIRSNLVISILLKDTSTCRGGAGTPTSDLLITRRPALPPEPQAARFSPKVCVMFLAKETQTQDMRQREVEYIATKLTGGGIEGRATQTCKGCWEVQVKTNPTRNNTKNTKKSKRQPRNYEQQLGKLVQELPRWCHMMHWVNGKKLCHCIVLFALPYHSKAALRGCERAV